MSYLVVTTLQIRSLSAFDFNPPNPTINVYILKIVLNDIFLMVADGRIWLNINKVLALVVVSPCSL